MDNRELEIAKEIAELRTDIKHILNKVENLTSVSEFSLFKKITLTAFGAIASIMLMLVKKIGL